MQVSARIDPRLGQLKQLFKDIEFNQQLDAVKEEGYDMGLAAVRSLQADGEFPANDADLLMLAKSKGRRLYRISDPFGFRNRIRFQRIPIQMRWSAVDEGSIELVFEAAREAYKLLLRRAQVLTQQSRMAKGNYLRSVDMFITTDGGASYSSTGGRTGVLRDNFAVSPNVRVLVGPNVRYGTPLEQGFQIDKYNRTRNRADFGGTGVVRPIAQQLRRKWGRFIAIRFTYSTVTGGNRGTSPVIEVGPLNAFRATDWRRGGGPARSRGTRY